jgi:hypothetical protein
VARIVVVAADLMLASRIDANLRGAGHEVELTPSISEAADLDGADLLVADLDTESPEALVGLGIPVLGYYSHTDAKTREAADAAGVDVVVPRSRLVREMHELVERLLAAA